MKRKRLFEGMISPSSGVRGEGLAVLSAERAGMVDGVHVDFRHPDIEPGQWEARYWWPVWGDSETHCGFCFPSEGKHSEAELRADYRLSNPAFPLVIACPGDKISVETVTTEIVGGPFDHIHDRTKKMASLALHRSDGSIERIDHRMALYGVTQLKRGPQFDTYDRLAARILSSYPDADPLKFGITQAIPDMFSRSLGEDAAEALEDAELSIEKLRRAGLIDGELGNFVKDAISSAARAGFLQAKHESKPAETKMERVQQGAASGRSKAKAKDSRLRRAERIWRQHPQWTANRVAARVAQELYDADEVKSPPDPSAIRKGLIAAHKRGDIEIPSRSPSHPEFGT